MAARRVADLGALAALLKPEKVIPDATPVGSRVQRGPGGLPGAHRLKSASCFPIQFFGQGQNPEDSFAKPAPSLRFTASKTVGQRRDAIANGCSGAPRPTGGNGPGVARHPPLSVSAPGWPVLPVEP